MKNKPVLGGRATLIATDPIWDQLRTIYYLPFIYDDGLSCADRDETILDENNETWRDRDPML